MPSQPAEGPRLRRAVNRWEIVFLALNDVVGSGVYLLPAATAALLGFASLGAIALAGAAVLLLVLCFAEAATHFEEPGGAYLYARAAFGDFVGFEVGWMTWVARVASAASLSAGFAQAAEFVWPAARGGWERALLAGAPLLLLTWINVLGVKAGVRTAVGLVVAKLVPLLVFVAVGIFHVSWHLARSQPSPGGGGLGKAALILLFAYAGFENTPAAAGEYRDPRRDVPRALLIEILVVTILYVLVQWVALGTLPALAGSPTPLADAASRFLGDWAGWLLTLGAVLSILGTNGNTTLAGPRYLFALACDGFGPRALARVHPRYRTPAVAVVVQGAIALPLALSGTFVALAALSVIARLATYLGTAAAVPVLRRKLDRPRRGFRLWGGATIPALACALSLAFAASATRSELAAGVAALLVGALLYRFRRPASSAA